MLLKLFSLHSLKGAVFVYMGKGKGEKRLAIAGFHKISMLDYPGQLAAICFFQGCQLRCPFCYNPGLVLPELFVEKKEQLKTSREFFAYLAQRRGLIDAVVLSGGEPLFQNKLLPLLKQIKESGFLVKLDTNGLLPGVLAKILGNGLVDYVALDYKNCPEGLPEATGTLSAQAMKNYQSWGKSLALLNSSAVQFELRTTVVKELHPPLYLEKMAEALKNFDLKTKTPWFWQSFERQGPLLADYTKAGCGKTKLTAYSPTELKRLVSEIKSIAVDLHLREAG